jgi:hypothetical protein
MLKKAVLAFFNHERPEVNSVRSHNFNELALVEIGDPSLDRTQGREAAVSITGWRQDFFVHRLKFSGKGTEHGYPQRNS